MVTEVRVLHEQGKWKLDSKDLPDGESNLSDLNFTGFGFAFLEIWVDAQGGSYKAVPLKQHVHMLKTFRNEAP